MHLAARLNEIPKPLWILAMIMGFVWFWPVGLGIALMLGSRWRSCGRGRGRGRWMYVDQNGQAQDPMSAMGSGMGWGAWGGGNSASQSATPSGNAAFDDYRAATLRRLEDEQKEFVDYLERLRQAKDKTEFDQFMADRRRPPMQQEPYAQS